MGDDGSVADVNIIGGGEMVVEVRVEEGQVKRRTYDANV